MRESSISSFWRFLRGQKCLEFCSTAWKDRLPDGPEGNSQSWKELLVDLKARDLSIARKWPSAMARSDFGKRSTSRFQRRAISGAGWPHKTLYVLDNIPKSQPKLLQGDKRLSRFAVAG